VPSAVWISAPSCWSPGSTSRRLPPSNPHAAPPPSNTELQSVRCAASPTSPRIAPPRTGGLLTQRGGAPPRPASPPSSTSSRPPRPPRRPLCMVPPPTSLSLTHVGPVPALTSPLTCALPPPHPHRALLIRAFSPACHPSSFPLTARSDATAPARSPNPALDPAPRPRHYQLLQPGSLTAPPQRPQSAVLSSRTLTPSIPLSSRGFPTSVLTLPSRLLVPPAHGQQEPAPVPNTRAAGTQPAPPAPA
jgi:hypothetical protein